jgi:hypothetical protein
LSSAENHGNLKDTQQAPTIKQISTSKENVKEELSKMMFLRYLSKILFMNKPQTT